MRTVSIFFSYIMFVFDGSGGLSLIELSLQTVMVFVPHSIISTLATFSETSHAHLPAAAAD